MTAAVPRRRRSRGRLCRPRHLPVSPRVERSRKLATRRAARPRAPRWREFSFSCIVVHPSGTQEHALRREGPAEVATDAPASCCPASTAPPALVQHANRAAPPSTVASWVRVVSNQNAKARAENLPAVSRNVALVSPSVTERARDRTQSRASAALHSGSIRLRTRSCAHVGAPSRIAMTNSSASQRACALHDTQPTAHDLEVHIARGTAVGAHRRRPVARRDDHGHDARCACPERL